MPKATKPLLEIWSEISGSFEDTRTKIRTALRSAVEFVHSEDDYITLEATFPDRIVVRVNDGMTYEPQYYQADWAEDETGKISFTNKIACKPETVVKAITEEKAMLANVFPERKDFGEDILTTITLRKITESKAEGSKSRYVGSVKIAQKAERKNENDRLYPHEVLKKAINEVNERIAKFGPLLMDYIHREKDGQNFRNIRETVALIHKVVYHDDTKTVSLDEITMVETAAGKDIIALLESGAILGVSQRGAGLSMMVEDNGVVYEKVTELHISGWDFTAGGDASVTEAIFEFKVLSEGIKMTEQRLITEDDLKKTMAEAEGRIATTVKDGIVASLKEAGIIKDKNEKATTDEATPEDEVTGETATEPEKEKPALADVKPKEEASATAENEGKMASELTELSKAHKQKLTELDKKGAELDRILAEQKHIKEMGILKENTTKIIAEVLLEERFDRFTPAQKAILVEAVNVGSMDGKVKVDDLEAIKAKINENINLEMVKLDRILADVGLTQTGYPKRGEGGTGITITHVNEQTPGLEIINRLIESVEKKISPKVNWWMPKEDPAMGTLSEMLAKFDIMHWKELKKLDEGAEDVTQADIGVRVAVMARALIPVAWRLITAFQVVDTHSVTARIEDVPIASWLPAEIADIADAMKAVEVGESQTIASAGIKYENCPVVSMIRKLKTMITAEAKLTAAGTIMNPLSDAVGGLALDISSRMDRALWWIQIVRGLSYGVTQVTDYTQLTVVPGSTYEFQYATSNKQAWIPYEYVKTYDSPGNPTGGTFIKLFGTTSGNSYQAVVVAENGGDATALVYGDDYSINWPDGTITLTVAGLAKCANDGTPKAKWSYSTNAKTWSVIPPTGVNGYENLINLRSAIGQAKVLIGNRNYNPSWIGMSLENEDRITSGPMFTNAGATPADIMDRLNNVLSFAGLRPIKSSAIPQAWMPIGEMGAAVYVNQNPFNVTGPHVNTDTGDEIYIALESAGYDVPKTAKLSAVGIQDLASLA